MNEAQLIPVKLPNILALQGCLTRARAWVTDLEEIQVEKKKEKKRICLMVLNKQKYLQL